MNLTEKQWKLINEISLKIHLTDDVFEMRTNFLSLIGALLEFDEASFYVQEGDNPYGSPIGINLSQEDLNDYINKYAQMDPFTSLIGIFLDAHAVFRSSDYVVTTDIETTPYYNTVWKPKNIRYSLLIPLSVNKNWLGSVNLFRHNDKSDFTETEMEIANILRQHLQARLWREKYFTETLNGAFPADKTYECSIKKMVAEYSLTDRECDVIRLWIKGLTDAEICDRLFISKNTLKKHISNIFRKLEINSRVELLRIMGRE